MNLSFRTSKFYFNNRLFSVNGDLEFYFELKKSLSKLGINSSTSDLIENSIDAEVCLDNIKPSKSDNYKILILLESKAVFPNLYNKEFLKGYNLVFTYDNFLVDNNLIYKLNYSYYLDFNSSIIGFKNKKFLCNISSNKFSSFYSELYSERRKVIKYFNQKHPTKFDLYGFGWDLFLDNDSMYNLSKFLNDYRILRYGLKIFLKTFKTLAYKKLEVYNGSIASKYKVLMNYKFSICFENYYNEDGYITEKIFDCFKCKVIPIYYGYKNIKNLIPNDSFIDYRDFNSLDSLYNYLVNISEEDYTNYLLNAQEFLKSNLANSFNAKENAKRVSNIIYDKINNKF